MITKQCLIKILNEIQDYGKKLIDGSDGVVVANISNEMVADYLMGEFVAGCGVSDAVWTTKEGKRLRVGDMSDEHIKNCYQFVSDMDAGEDWKSVFKAEAIKRRIELKEDTINEAEQASAENNKA